MRDKSACGEQQLNTDSHNAKHIAAVVLNYNSEQDLMVCVPQLAAQTGVQLSLILVDNASKPDSVKKIKVWLTNWQPDAVIGTRDEVNAWVKCNLEDARCSGKVYFITHHENHGYSAGNNIGARLATRLGCDAVLIINPDVRIQDPAYLLKLSSKLMSEHSNAIAASAIYNLHGHNENPMLQLKFVDELLLPLRNIFSLLGIRNLSSIHKNGEFCDQVSGSCLLFKCSFLQEIGYFDEAVFLYCEEAILATQVRQAGKRIVYVPEIRALHAHQSSAKGARAKRTRLWIKSREYYLSRYTNYGAFSRFLLQLSHHALLSLMRLRDVFPK